MEINNLKLLIDKINREIDSLDDVSVDNCDENNILIVETLTYHFDIDDPGRNYDVNYPPPKGSGLPLNSSPD